MTIDSLVHSNPTSPNGNGGRRTVKRPSIDVYFLQSGVQQRRDAGGSWNAGNKRYRDSDEGGGGGQGRSKRVYS